jgi:hypothetical protein
LPSKFGAAEVSVDARLEKNPHFAAILCFAKGVLKANGHTKLDLPHIALGAYSAYTAGALKESRVLQLHMQQYQPEIDRFTKTAGWLQASTQDDAKYDISDALSNALDETVKAEDPLISFINAGLNAVNEEVKLFNTAIHEAGHAVISLVLRPEVRLVKVTIARDEEMSAGGYAQYDGTSVTFKEVPSREFAFEHICVCLAGRVAQVAEFGPDAADVGAMSDMDKATQMACMAVTLYGLDPELGPISLDVVARFLNRLPGGLLNQGDIAPLVSKLRGLAESNHLTEDEVAALVGVLTQNNISGQPSGYLFDLAQRRIQYLIKQAYVHTEQLVAANKEAINRVAELLLEKKTVTEEELLAVLPRLTTIIQTTQGA